MSGLPPLPPRPKQLELVETASTFISDFSTDWDSKVLHTYATADSAKDRPVLVCVHGGGHTGLSWDALARRMNDVVIIAPDLPSHGLSDPADMDIDSLVEATEAAVCDVYVKLAAKGATVLVGHSLGGSIAVRLAKRDRIPSIKALVVLDAVETTALASLSHMSHFVKNIPKRFPTRRAAVEWSLHNMLKNSESARVSIPSQLKLVDDHYEWRLDLSTTEKFWRGWFDGLTEMFLGCSGVYKVLMVAGRRDTLDKKLIVGHMQGKYQLIPLPHSGHVLMEDQPDAVAVALTTLIKRLSLTETAAIYCPP
ncbi:MAG: hypothetical protein KVP17_003052 [Porospora cf. gigantea B]|uniref:uncharacterized protein n=2 Tax=Porospora cf. gigantea B TaxID=2853592 RepID=UPI0035719BFE|nr:MAG: hypothetical protein KVP17_003052 [Porospora cf. gigantea B]